MNCIKCYQEIPDGSRFCPYCGAEQTAAEATGEVYMQQEPAGKPEAGTQDSAPVQQGPDTQSQDTSGTKAQGSSDYGSGYQYGNYQNGNQNNYQNGSVYQNNYQNAGYQTGPSYQQDQGEPVNWVPYLVLSIISTICCCIPFGIVAIVFSAKINSAVTMGNMEEARKAAKTARIWIIAAFVLGIVATILYAIIMSMIGAGSYYYYY